MTLDQNGYGANELETVINPDMANVIYTLKLNGGDLKDLVWIMIAEDVPFDTEDFEGLEHKVELYYKKKKL